jgi:hypothetical protein
MEEGKSPLWMLRRETILGINPLTVECASIIAVARRNALLGKEGVLL